MQGLLKQIGQANRNVLRLALFLFKNPKKKDYKAGGVIWKLLSGISIFNQTSDIIQ